MRHHTHTTTWRKRARVAALIALPALVLAPVAARSVRAEMEMEESGPGTEFVKCQDEAWVDYNKCLMNARTSWEKKLCDLAFEADVVWCGSVYWRRVKTGL